MLTAPSLLKSPGCDALESPDVGGGNAGCCWWGLSFVPGHARATEKLGGGEWEHKIRVPCCQELFLGE